MKETRQSKSKARRLAAHSMNSKIEVLSVIFHDIYVAEAIRQGDLRHPEKYEDLPDNIQEYNRVVSRYMMSLIAMEKNLAYREGISDCKRFFVINILGKVFPGITKKLDGFIKDRTCFRKKF